MHNQSAIAVMNANYPTFEGINSSQLFPQDAAIITTMEATDWGAFKKSQIISYSGRDTVKQAYLLSSAFNKDMPALYLRDNDEDFKISGNTILQGDIYISGRGLKIVNLAGIQSVDKPVHSGTIYTSEKIVPNITPLELIYPEEFVLKLPSDIKTNVVINGFDKKTIVIDVGTVLENIKLKGNIIIRSQDTINIKDTAILEDIIIEAPKIVFQEGFKGNLQVFASKEVVMETGTLLAYPSVIVVGPNESEGKSIVLKEDSNMNGSILLYGNGLKDESKHKINIGPNATVNGTIYCDGVLALYGTVNGSVIASLLEHKTPTTHHRNLIFNGKILADKIPNPYFQVQTLEKYMTDQPVILKKL
tara:strand:+ start:20756 stop:21838 length:1083 start_codon:yes stop_codon:yes gene_type:complete